MLVAALARSSPALAVAAALLLAGAAGRAQEAPGATPTVVTTADPTTLRLALVPLPVTFQQPVLVTNAGDGSGRLFVVEKAGRIIAVRGETRVEPPFLDIRPLVGSRGSEQGLLGLAFHPRYAETGLFFVNYTDVNGDTVVARYHVSEDPDRADPGSATTLLTIDQPAPNHNGGTLVFGPDGYLYIGMGDGGGAGDRFGNAQNRGTLLGKMLRIDVDGGEPYAIPADNPFVGEEGTRPEIWALGLRNPWRYSFDRLTGDLYIADVGQNAWEEVNVQPAGAGGGQNYGWPILEASHCFRASDCDPSGYVQPVAEYGRDQGCSITGGHVYRGTAQPPLAGLYFFGDYCSGIIWALDQPEPGRWRVTELLRSGLQISSFGEDEAGEIYVASLGDGMVARLVAS